jgi:hypothetical protein
MPPLVCACVRRMREANPQWRVVVLTAVDLPEWLCSLPANVASDWIRLHKVADTGGVWLDASCICTQSVETWILNLDGCVSGFSSYDGALDSYAFAAPPRSVFIARWRDEFCASLRDPRAYADVHWTIAHECYIRWDSTTKTTLQLKLPYLNVVLCSAVAMRECHGEAVHLIDAHRPGGAFHFETASLFAPAYRPDTPLLKLDNVDRRIAARLFRCVTKGSGIVAQLLHAPIVQPRRSLRLSSKVSPPKASAVKGDADRGERIACTCACTGAPAAYDRRVRTARTTPR